MADSDAGSDDVADTDSPGLLAWEPFKRVRIVAHDGFYAKLVCLRCPADRPPYVITGSLAGVIKWAIEHYQFLHQTQVAVRD